MRIEVKKYTPAPLPPPVTFTVRGDGAALLQLTQAEAIDLFIQLGAELGGAREKAMAELKRWYHDIKRGDRYHNLTENSHRLYDFVRDNL